MKYIALLIAALVGFGAPATARTIIDTAEIPAHICPLLEAPFVLQTGGSDGCEWILPDPEHPDVPLEKVSLAISFGIKEDEFRYMSGYLASPITFSPERYQPGLCSIEGASRSASGEIIKNYAYLKCDDILIILNAEGKIADGRFRDLTKAIVREARVLKANGVEVMDE